MTGVSRGIPSFFNSINNFPDGSETKISGFRARLVMLDTPHVSDLEDIIRPAISKITSAYPGVYAAMDFSHYPDWNSWFKQNYDDTPTGHGTVMGSRLLDEKALTGNDTALRIALQDFSAGGEASVFIVSGKGVHNAQPRGGGNAVLPAWRKAARPCQ